jgi:hypothetical protein
MKNEMRLQGIGMVKGTEAGKLQVGDITRWNNGYLEKVTSIEFSKTGKTIIVGIEYYSRFKDEMVQSERKMRVTRLVNIVASGNTKLTSYASYEIIEEVAEAEEVTEAPEAVIVQIEESTDLKKSVHEITYRVTNHGSYVEIMLFVTDIANDVTLVAQQEGEFKNMEEANTLIAYLRKTGNKIEFVETMAYTG